MLPHAFRRISLVVALCGHVCLSGVAFSQDRAATAKAMAETCVEGAMTLPLLGGPDDAPVIPVRIDGREAAMYVSPLFAHLFVRNAGAIWFAQGPSHRMIAQDNAFTLTEQTRVDTLEIGQFVLHDLIAERLEDAPVRMVDGRPLMGVIGRPILQHLRLMLMLDVPHEKLGLIAWRDGPECAAGPETLFTRTPEIVDLDQSDHITMKIDRHPVRVRLDPDLVRNVLPKDLVESKLLPAAELARDDSVVTKFGDMERGVRHRFDAVQIGGRALGATEFLVLENLAEGALGASFFRNEVALIDFAHGKFMFAPAPPSVHQPDLSLHFDMSRETTVTVHDAPRATAR